MRLIHYSVIEKATGKRVFAHCQECKCQDFLKTLENKDDYYIGYKWKSI